MKITKEELNEIRVYLSDTEVNRLNKLLDSKEIKLPTDEIIAITFPIYGGDESELLDEINQYRREGAKWMRDQIKNQLETKE